MSKRLYGTAEFISMETMEGRQLLSVSLLVAAGSAILAPLTHSFSNLVGTYNGSAHSLAHGSTEIMKLKITSESRTGKLTGTVSNIEAGVVTRVSTFSGQISRYNTITAVASHPGVSPVTIKGTFSSNLRTLRGTFRQSNDHGTFLYTR
jgi:hypothetical protein